MDALGQIEASIMQSEPISDLLQKVVILSGQVNSIELRAWALRELKGYAEEPDVPQYRQLEAMILADVHVGPMFYRAHPVPAWKVQVALRRRNFEVDPSIVSLRQPVAALEGLVAERDLVKHTIPWEPLLKLEIDREYEDQHTVSVYWGIPPSSVIGLLSGIRTALSELVAEIRAEVGQDGAATAQAVDKGMHQVFDTTINAGIVNVAQGSSGFSQSVTVQERDVAEPVRVLDQAGLAEGEVGAIQQIGETQE